MLGINFFAPMVLTGKKRSIYILFTKEVAKITDFHPIKSPWRVNLLNRDLFITPGKFSRDLEAGWTVKNDAPQFGL